MTNTFRQVVWGASLLAGMAGAVMGQSTAGKLEFEVASIKAAAPMTGGMFRIGSHVDGALVSYENQSLRDLIRVAYRMKDFQVQGPDWLNTTRFDINAKIPEGGNKDQVPEMLQALLADRFKLTVHKESKPHDSFALVVAKGGPKLTPAEDKDDGPVPSKMTQSFGGPSGGEKAATEKAAAEGAQMRMTVATRAAGGGGGGAGVIGFGGAGGVMKMQLKSQTLAQFAESISRFVGAPVVDLTEIQGKYDFALEFTREDMARGSGIMVMKGGMMGGGGGGGGDASHPAGDIDADSGSTLFKSVQDYGLKLDKRKAPIDIVVVDKMEKAPTEN